MPGINLLDVCPLSSTDCTKSFIYVWPKCTKISASMLKFVFFSGFPSQDLPTWRKPVNVCSPLHEQNEETYWRLPFWKTVYLKDSKHWNLKLLMTVCFYKTCNLKWRQFFFLNLQAVPKLFSKSGQFFCWICTFFILLLSSESDILQFEIHNIRPYQYDSKNTFKIFCIYICSMFIVFKI